MNKLQDLRNLVDKLEAKTYSKEIVQTLQEIGAKLINEYDIKVGNLTIEPLLVEAYYYNCDKLHGFQDENCHRQPEQRGQEHFGTLYFHKKGYGGVDLCLPCGDYYLSFLLKCSRITNDDIICRQTTLYDVLKQEKKVQLVSKFHAKYDQIVYLPRKGLKKETYKTEPLAILLVNEVVHKPVAVSLAKGKQWTLAKYAIENGKKDIKSANDFLKEKKLYNAKLEDVYFKGALDYVFKDSMPE